MDQSLVSIRQETTELETLQKMAEPTFNPPRNCRRVLPEIFINHLKDQATETSDVPY